MSGDAIKIIRDGVDDFVMRYGFEPTSIYLGREERHQLAQVVRDLTHTQTQPGQRPEAVIFGLDVFWVDTDTHFKVA
jgi:hypothetical protein